MLNKSYLHVLVSTLVPFSLFLILFARSDNFPLSSFIVSALLCILLLSFFQYRKFAFLRFSWPFEPNIFFLVAFSSIFILRPLSIIIQDSYFNLRVGNASVYISDDSMSVGLFICLLSFIFYLAGLFLFSRIASSNSASSVHLPWQRGLAIGLFFTLFGVFLSLVFWSGTSISLDMLLESRGGWENDASVLQRSSGYIFLGRLFCIPGMAIYVLYSYRSQKRLIILSSFLVFLLLFFVLGLFGSRLIVLFLFLSFIVSRAYSLKKRIKFVGLFSFIVFFYLFYNFFQVARTNYRYYYQNPEEAVTESSSNIASFSGSDMTTFDRYLSLLDFFPKHKSYLLGETIYEAAVSWVPRQLWPNKPMYGLSKHFFPTEARAYFGANFSVVGESWANFGWFGVTIILFLVGVAVGYLEKRRSTQTDDDGSFVFVFSISLSLFYSVNASPWGVIAMIGFFIVPSVAHNYFIRDFNKKRTRGMGHDRE
jgi:oligosaccharide repeat unit polymerase